MANQKSAYDWKGFHAINRKLHIHFGMFLLLFIWLFFISGLIIHHGNWKFAKFYEKRIESKQHFVLPVGNLDDKSVLANKVKKNLNISGEIQNMKIKNGSIDFRVSSPGLLHDIHIDQNTGNGTMKIMKYNFWGKLHTLHLFNGMNKNNPSVTPNWIVTKLWRLMMDITAVILIILCLGSWIMWYKVRRDYRLGYIFLGVGLMISVYFIFLI